MTIEQSEKDSFHVCIDCKSLVYYLEVFPGPRCLKCYEPIGECKARDMTALDLALLWGAK